MGDKAIKFVVKKAKDFGAQKVLLFGSRASGHSRPDSDMDLCLILDRPIKIGDKAKLLSLITKSGYDWEIEPDFHLFSAIDFNKKLESGDLFASQISKGRVIYG